MRAIKDSGIKHLAGSAFFCFVETLLHYALPLSELDEDHYTPIIKLRVA
jgi:hypothetical protein